MTFIPKNKIVFTAAERKFILDNYQTMSNKELASALGKQLTRLRMEVYSMGLKRMELQYWTEEQIQFLRDNYKTIGDTELAELFADRWDKDKGWSKKHIEKKRRYLKLKRTDSEKKAIWQRNLENGAWSECATKRWKTIGANVNGTIVTWKTTSGRPIQMIKIDGKYIHLNVHTWEQANGKVPKGMNVVRLDGNPLNTSIENLTLMSNSELAIHNSKNRMKYPEEIREVQRLLNKLNKKIKEHGKK